jgi:hypothetical protein
MLIVFAEFTIVSDAPYVPQFLSLKYTGCFGGGSDISPFSRNETIDDVSGRAFGLS